MGVHVQFLREAHGNTNHKVALELALDLKEDVFGYDWPEAVFDSQGEVSIYDTGSLISEFEDVRSDITDEFGELLTTKDVDLLAKLDKYIPYLKKHLDRGNVYLWVAW